MGFLHTSFLIAVTAIAVIYIPKLFTERLPVIINGTTEPGFEEVLNTFRENFETGIELPFSGSAFSAYYKGKKVVDIWGGYADAQALHPWREDTMAVVFSVTKGMAALCMAILVDRGHLDYNTKVSDYWPEFAQNGKENVTVRMLLSHEAGLAMADTTLSLRLLQDYQELGNVLARSPPIWEPGTAHGYHAITFGLYASQLLTRADPKKRTLGQFFKDEVAKPFGIEFYIGLPMELNYRVSRFETGAMNLFMAITAGIGDPIQRSIAWEMFVTGDAILKDVIDNAGELTSNRYIMNDPEYRATESASLAGIGTAEALAKVYSILANGGKNEEGKMLLSEEIIAEIYAGDNTSKDKVLGVPTRFSHGMFFAGEGQWFGHPGAGGNMGFAIMEHNLGVGYVTRYQSPYGFGNDPRFLTLQSAIDRCIAKLEAK